MSAALIALAVLAVPSWAKDTAAESVKTALSRGDYPWYDADADKLRALAPPAEPSAAVGGTSALAASVGQVVVFVLLTLILVGLVALLIWAWNKYAPDAPRLAERKEPRRGGASRLESLQLDAENLDSSDLWGEAQRRRAKGDFRGAVIALFLFEIQLLERRQLIRLMPGRTGRQLVRSVKDRSFRDRVEPALRLFEQVYYGGQPPDEFELNRVWMFAEELRGMQ